MPRSTRLPNSQRLAPSHRLDRHDRGSSSSPLIPPAHVQARKRESQQQQSYSNSITAEDEDRLVVYTNPSESSPTEKMAATRTRSQLSSSPLPRLPRPSSRRNHDVRPERKASVRKEQYEFDDDDDEDDDEQDNDSENGEILKAALLGEEDEESDLSDAPPPPEENGTSAIGQIDPSDYSDDDMAAKLQAAGDGESLLGSGDSDDGQEDDEERYIIADAAKAESKANARIERLKLLEEKRAEQGRRRWANSNANRSRSRYHIGGSNFNESAQDGDVEDLQMGSAEEGFGSLSPETMRLLGLPVLEDELFHEQEGFHSDSEPSFSDFFGSEGEGAQPDDDDELTSFDTSDDGDDDDISDLENDLVGEPFLAHVGSVDPVGGAAALDLATAMQAGADIARQDIPLLVIEDLDGRLIYARAGDGEAVFGSDGEFEFVDSDEDDDSDDDDYGRALDSRDPRWATSGRKGEGRGYNDDAQVFEDDGDTTDELPDEDMPFPRLLVGSVDPRGGRTSRRARAMAAQLRRLSPNASGSNIQKRQCDGTTLTDEAASSVEYTTTPATEVDVSFPHMKENYQPTAVSTNVASSLPSTTTTFPALPATPSSKGRKPASQTISADDLQRMRPEMGSFMPSSSKSVHRAVIDGSSQAASPFTSKYSLQRKGLVGRRRPRRSSFSSHSIKRIRRDSLTAGSGDQFSETALSSPETIKTAVPLPMDLDDVVDASMLWRSGDSSDTGTGDGLDDDSNASDDTTMPAVRNSRRSRTKTGNISDGFGLNSNAFSRWRKIPMGAFRNQQQSLSRGGIPTGARGHPPVTGANGSSSAGRSRGRGEAATHQPLGNCLLQRVSSTAARRFDHSPFRRTGSHGGSLHMVVPSVSAASQKGRGNQHQQSFIVSPVLWPVRGSHRGNIEGSDSASTPRRNKERDEDFGLRGTLPFAQSSAVSDTGPRKMTKREKRERKAQRAAARAAARAEKQRIRDEALAGTTVLGEPVKGGEAEVETAAVQGTPAPLLHTPNLGVTTDSGHRHALNALSPANGMPRLRITESSPRSSPVRPTLLLQQQQQQQNKTVGSTQAGLSSTTTWQLDQQEQQHIGGTPTTMVDSSPTYLPGDTPPTRAVTSSGVSGLMGGASAGGGGTGASSSFPPSTSATAPSLPSSSMLFGPPLASPLFGGMFAPLNMEPADEGELEAEGAPGGAQALLI